MRKKIVSIESDLVDRSPEWGATILSSFGRISRALPPLLITVAMTVVLSPLILSQVQNNSGANQYYFAISYPIFFFGAGTFIWTYASALWGLNEIGRRPIRLRSFREDALMGLGGFGSIALSLTFVFFVAVFLGTLLISAFASDLPLVLFGLFTGVLTLLGLAVFFLPLENIHSKMRAEKERLHQAVVARIVELSRTDDSKGGAATSLKDTLLLEDELKDIEALPTWPFDTPIIGRLIIVVLSIIVSIVSRLILASLNL